MSDADTERFYALERDARAAFEPADALDMSLSECERMVHAAYGLFGEWPDRPVIVDAGADGQRAGTCRCEPGAYVLGFPAGRRRPWCVLHEAAHTLAPAEHGGHGPLFASLCLRLWASRLCGWPAGRLREMADRHCVREWQE